MSRIPSPLRYPGGKTCLYDVAAQIIRINQSSLCDYAEPFAGGCGLALSLLFGGHVSDIHINDVDVAIWSFWDSVLNREKDLIHLIETTNVTVDEWYRQRDIYLKKDKRSRLKLGFSAFFLNRTNRSGIIKGAGMIGGMKQTGKYKINCRYNVQDLVRKVRRIAKYRDRIHLTNLDALDFLERIDRTIGENTFLCIDPPYYQKGSSLYTNFYRNDDHAKLAKAVKQLSNPWIVTYDRCVEIESLYKNFRTFPFGLNYSVQTKRVGTEILISSRGLRLPKEIREGTLLV